MYSAEGYHALRSGCGVVRRGDRGVLIVTGADRIVWLQGLLSNDVASLSVGSAMYAAYLTPQGRMISDLRVVHFSDRTYLDVPAALAASLQRRMDALIFAEDAAIADATDSTLIVEAHGPALDQVLARVQLPAGSFTARDDVYYVPGLVHVVSRAAVDDVVGRLIAAGAMEITLETLDVVRIESGRPAFLVDMDEHTIPLEAGIEDRAISFTKGCYVGQEVIVRVLHRGQGRVAKKLVGLLFAKSDVPHAGAAIAAGNREIGRLTSTAWSPALERPIALGYVHRDFVESGTPVEVIDGTGRLPVTVASLPFVA